MGIIASALVGLGVGGATWRYMRFKNGDSTFGLSNQYLDYPIPVAVKHDGSKPTVPWKQKPYFEILDDIKTAVKKKTSFEGYNLRHFYATKLAEEDAIVYGQVIHEAHLHMRHGKNCKIYLRGDHFILRVS